MASYCAWFAKDESYFCGAGEDGLPILSRDANDALPFASGELAMDAAMDALRSGFPIAHADMMRRLAQGDSPRLFEWAWLACSGLDEANRTNDYSELRFDELLARGEWAPKGAILDQDLSEPAELVFARVGGQWLAMDWRDRASSRSSTLAGAAHFASELDASAACRDIGASDHRLVRFGLGALSVRLAGSPGPDGAMDKLSCALEARALGASLPSPPKPKPKRPL